MSMQSTDSSPLWKSKIRSIFWPIHNHELPKVLPMLAIYTLIVFIYSLLKSAKDALVVTARNSGAETLPFIKFWAILPMAMGFAYLFTKLSNKYSREKVFYIMMIIFLSYFFIFSFILYPLREYIHPHAFADFIQSVLPDGFSGLISVFRNWSFTLYYVMSEMWGTMIMTVLFWGFANEVSSINEAKRFYIILGVGANLATVLAGGTSRLTSHLPWEHSLATTSLLVTFGGCLIMYIYRWMNKNVFSSCPEGFEANTKQKQKITMSLRKNFSYLAQSKYLLCIALIVLAFNISINMVEIVWKHQVKILYPSPTEYQNYMGSVMMLIGATSTIFALFFYSNVIRIFGWTVSALVTPVMMLVTSFLFFGFAFIDESHLQGISLISGMAPLALSVSMGSLQNILTRASKFTFFDSTKEMSFIPLSKESKLKGKAAIDGVGSRIGKVGGSIVHQVLMIIFGSVALATPVIAVVLFLVVAVWLFAVQALGLRFSAITGENDVVSQKKQDPVTT